MSAAARSRQHIHDAAWHILQSEKALGRAVKEFGGEHPGLERAVEHCRRLRTLFEQQSGTVHA